MGVVNTCANQLASEQNHIREHVVQPSVMHQDQRQTEQTKSEFLVAVAQTRECGD